ncbi:hypothetical protein GH714_002335 [Hevea brasiliensis]|uniref:non-specific serine/threonine protein kinase n=1 Tax=Hevea brasiliensis TaxID=3981 RepID=A0A6A6LI43_HEVBR|nr:hypothetical protein GH714_002335 [Hevea brasiliensis]
MNNEELLSISIFDGKIMHREIIEATKNFDSMYCIGEGRFGRVYKAELLSGDIVAVKKFHSLPHDEMADQKEFLNEIRFTSTSLGVAWPRSCNDEAAKEFGWDKRLTVIKGVAYALYHMHHECIPPIVHRDISSKNVLLDSEYEAHVSDFGTAKLLNLDSSNRTMLAGTYGYVAPGLVLLWRPSVASDSTQDLMLFSSEQPSSQLKDSNISLKWHHHPQMPPIPIQEQAPAIGLEFLSIKSHPFHFWELEIPNCVAYVPNKLSGQIPQQIGNLKSLNKLSLWGNYLSGPIPTTLCGLTNLTLLHLYENKLSGPIPNEVGNLKFIPDMELSENQLSGPISTSLGQEAAALKQACSSFHEHSRNADADAGVSHEILLENSSPNLCFY